MAATLPQVKATTPGRPAGRDLWVTLGILLAALGLRLYGLTGEMFFDPIIYAQNAYNLLHGTFTLKTDSWYAHRLTVFLPEAPIYALFGVGSLASRVWPLTLSLCQIGLLMALARRLFDRPTAYLAGTLAAIVPLDAILAGVLNPDIVLASFLTGAAVFWLLGLEGRERPSRALLYLSGLCFALALVTRENGAILLLFYVGYVAWRRPSLRLLLWPVLGGLTVAVPLLAVYIVQTGDPLYRLGVVFGRFANADKGEGTRFLYYPRLFRNVLHSMTGLFPWVFAAGVLGGLLRPTRGRGLLLLWALPMVLYLQFGSMSFSSYQPMVKQERYLTPLSIPLCLLAASVLLEWLRWIEGRVFRRRPAGPAALGPVAKGLLLLGLLLLSFNSLYVVREQSARGRRSYAAVQSVLRILRENPRLPVFFDHWRTGYRYAYYLGFKEGADFYRGGNDRVRAGHPGSFGQSRLGYLSWFPDPEQIPESLVVLDDDAMRKCREGNSPTKTYLPGDVPEYAYAPPASWRMLGQFGTFRVFKREL